MAQIKKKILKEYFDKVLSGDKTYELRLADWHIEAGDTLILQEWNPQTGELTGREIEKNVGFVGKTKDFEFWTKEEIDKYGYQIISLIDKA